MSKLSGFAGTNGAMVGAAGVVAVAAVGAAFWINARNAPDAAAPEPSEIVEAAVTPEAAAAPTPDAPAAKPEKQEIAPPSIDEVRLEPDGLTIIAGRAAPGSEVSVLLDGTKSASVTTDPGGSFAAITMLPPSQKAQVLTVVQRLGEDEISSVDEVIVAPAAPTAVADTEDATEAEEVATAQTQTGQPAPEVASTPEVPTAPEAPSAPEVPAAPEVAAAPEVSTAPEAIATAEPKTPTPEDEAVAETPTPTEETETPAPVVAAVTETPAQEPPAAVPEDDAPAQIAALPEADPQPAPAAAPAQTAETTPEPKAPETSDVASADVAPAAPVTVLKSTPEGVEVLSNVPPEALENIELDTISYSQSGDVQLTGRAQSEAEVVRVYVNNRPITDLDVDENGDWSGALPQIDTGVYTLRVDELNEAGTVTSRIETPFRREDPAVLAQSDDVESPATQITVQAGNSLWAIARDRYGEGRLYVQLFEANRDRIRNPDLIFPGQVFELPK
ncbi:LysM peptidoglycan-binding domain-containing protein [uncultured Tateyamaria sp.]|uniref:LysM peptidoglycan-binding domain-containing protein n=1 Tax=uncultured Tateyamaria sp. TaxID=455651 RepID=UPI00261A1907|nr:LysM peptidoglycan-binding domain-containing protein [uncultured Tateyamaria sp.]